ncbi:SAM-dependent methyltransferase [Lentzea sp. NPDC102401]|uniref:SAM-dependent methyltransferase n=1 Tax=Lentzea sp. NPDC102401 TaxID=3364128 RepID=UPI00380E6BBF
MRQGIRLQMVSEDRRGSRVVAERPSWAPEGVDVTLPSPARMYDALLGGWHNFEVDRNAASMAVRKVPDLPKVALSNRAFLRRSVRFLAENGIRQFLDIGSGIPTVGNVHEVALGVAPESRVQYVDIDAVAVAHSNAIVGGVGGVGAMEGDLRDPESLLAELRRNSVIDLSRPVAVLLVAVLHLITDDENPWEIVRILRDSIAPGSCVVISHLSSASRPDDAAQLGAQARNAAGVGIHFRTRKAVEALFDGWTLVAPGLVELPQWRPESAEDVYELPGKSLGLAGVGRKS